MTTMPRGMRLTEELPPVDASAHEARATVGGHLAAAGWPVRVIQVAEWLTSELATNAISSGGSSFSVTIDLTADVVRVEVTGRDPSSADAPPDEGEALTLHLVGQAATEWGVTSTRQGKSVWFQLERN